MKRIVIDAILEEKEAKVEDKKAQGLLKKRVIAAVMVFLIVVGGFLYWGFRPIEEEHEIIKQQNGYVLLGNASDYEKELFALLSEDLAEEAKANLIFQLFLANFYSLDLASSKNDIRGVQFVFEPFQDDFIKQVKQYVYYSVPNNYFVKKRQELPLVKEVVINETVAGEFVSGDITYKSYVIIGEVFYQKSPGYREQVELELIVNSDKIEVVRMDAILSGM